MTAENKIPYIIDNYGCRIVPENDGDVVLGLFASKAEALPRFLPFINTTARHFVFYTKQGVYLNGNYFYADTRWQTLASSAVHLNGEIVAVQSLLREKPIVAPEEPTPEPVIYPMTLTFGEFNISLDISEVTVKQDTMIVNVTAIDKFVEDRAIGSKPIEVTVKGTINRGDAKDFIDALKNPASKFEQPLTIGDLVSISAIVKEFKVLQTKEDEKQEFTVTFTEIRE